MTLRILDPSNEIQTTRFDLAPRLNSLKGKTVGFISNGKEGTAGFFAHLEQQLRREFEVGAVVLRTKANYSAPAEPAIIDEAKEWDLAISGLGD